MIRRPPRSTLFPTRRSSDLRASREDPGRARADNRVARQRARARRHAAGDHRSEEHTSELQSQSNLVCRLLLEKKKKNKQKKPQITTPHRKPTHTTSSVSHAH